MVWLTDARTPEGMRLYAIGDVHGCLEALHDVHRAIEADLGARPAADWRIVHLGDYVDRGADSRGVLDFLALRMADESRILCLRGNHDDMFVQGLAGDARQREMWLTNGGVETLESYGVGLADYLEMLRSGGVAQDIVPSTHRDLLGALLASARFGDYYFVHAGIDPQRALDEQRAESQLWIRAPFLDCGREFEAVIVHGHTPVPRVEVRANRLGIDTGAVFGGSLTCLVLEGADKGLLTAAGVTPLPPTITDDETQDTVGGSAIGRLLRRFGRRD